MHVPGLRRNCARYGTTLEVTGAMRGLRLAFACAMVFAACRQNAPATSTIAPADPRPAPTALSTVGAEPVITTTGSPPPASAEAPGTEIVRIRKEVIEVRPSLPRAHTVFRMVNETEQSHDIVLRGPSGDVTTSIPPRETRILQLRLVDAAYELTCVAPGHRERGRFETYRPGAPVR